MHIACVWTSDMPLGWSKIHDVCAPRTCVDHCIRARARVCPNHHTHTGHTESAPQHCACRRSVCVFIQRVCLWIHRASVCAFCGGRNGCVHALLWVFGINCNHECKHTTTTPHHERNILMNKVVLKRACLLFVWRCA